MVMIFSCAAFGMTAFAQGNYDEEENNCPHDEWYLYDAFLPATLKTDGRAEWECCECFERREFTTYKIKSVTIPSNAYPYTGKAIQPKVTVKDRTGKVIDKQYYTVTSKNHKNLGIATMKIVFGTREYGDLYKDTVTKTFLIYMDAPKVVNADKGFRITWKKQPGATGYEVWRSADNGKTYVKAKTLKGSNATTFTNTNDAANVNGRKYKYKIRPVMPGNTGFSRMKSCYKVARPTIKTISNTQKGIKLTWAKNSKATGYQIWRSDNGGKSYIKAKTIKTPSTTAFTNTAAAANKNGKKYYYKMRSYKTVNGITYYSTYSPVKTIVRKK